MYVCNAHTKRTNVRSEREKTKTKKVAAQILFYFIYFFFFFPCVPFYCLEREQKNLTKKTKCIFYVQHFDCYWIPAVAFRAMCL